MKQELITKKKELPEGWKFVRLGSILEMNYGKGLANAEREKGEIPVYGSNGVIGFNNDCLIDFNTIIIGRKGSAGELNFVERPCWPIDTTYYVATRYNLKFIYYLLKHINLKKITQKGAKPGLNREEAYDLITIFTEDENEQQKIVSKLDKQMEQIEMMKKEAEREIEDTRELLDSYLKDFFRNTVDETWHTSKLGDVCIINPRKPELVYSDNQPTSFIPMESVDAEGGVVNNPKIQPFVKVKKGYTYFEENEVLFAKITPCMQNKKSAIAKDLINKFGFGTTEWHVFRCKENILPEWVLYFIRQQSFIEQAKARFTGAVGQQRVPKDFIENYEISYPDIEVQKLLISKLKNIITEQENIMKDMTNQLNAISQLPSSILNEVFGQYKIPEEV